MASIGLVGNKYSIRFTHWLWPRELTDWLRSDWLETVRPALACSNSDALTDWLRSDWLETIPRALMIRSSSRNSLPIGFDRIGWKLKPRVQKDCLLRMAYRLASIGLVGNSEELDVFSVLISSLPIGFDRIGWKLDQGHKTE